MILAGLALLFAACSNNDSDIYLKSEYKYNSTSDTDFKNGIRIEREVTIHGNGHTIDRVLETTVASRWSLWRSTKVPQRCISMSR